MSLHNGKNKIFVKYMNKEYFVRFQHKKDFEGKSKYDDKMRIKGITIAYISERIENEYVVHAEAIAECSVKDHFDKKLGRTIALGRLLKMEDVTFIKHDER